MNVFTKSLLSAGAAAAALVSIAVPAQARERYDRHRDSVSAGEVIAGAVVIGGLAALLSAGKTTVTMAATIMSIIGLVTIMTIAAEIAARLSIGALTALNAGQTVIAARK